MRRRPQQRSGSETAALPPRKRNGAAFRLHFGQPRIYDLAPISASEIPLPAVRLACQSARIGASVFLVEAPMGLELLDPRIEVTTSFTAPSIRL